MRLGSMNIVIMLGRLTRDFEMLRVGDNKTPLAKSTIAVNRHYRGDDGHDQVETCFIDIEAWGKLGETLVRNFQKGDAILIRGRIRLNEWTDRQTGFKHRNHIVYVESFENIRDNNGSADDDSEALLRD